jgi:ABC-type tungstate transport system permease subunit
MMADLYAAAEAETPTNPPTRFLSRYDKSATNIKDSELWIGIGQVSWASKGSTWYHQYVAYPTQALSAAAALQEYTLTDWGTWLAVDEATRSKLTIYKRGTDDVKDLLLMPGHLLVGGKAKDLALANDFAAWAVGSEGQDLIRKFTNKAGEVINSPAL